MVHVEVVNAHRTWRVRHAFVEGCVRRVLRHQRRGTSNISVVFVDSQKIRPINRKFLGHDYVTDVISFTLEGGRNLEGEIYVNLDRARQQAKEYGVRATHEAARLVIHGVLHLLGYDDATTAGARQMKREEDRHLLHWFGQQEMGRR